MPSSLRQVDRAILAVDANGRLAGSIECVRRGSRAGQWRFDRVIGDGIVERSYIGEFREAVYELAWTIRPGAAPIVAKTPGVGG
ncbi:MAG TPA: hypothetical protein VG826_29105 [Pirellulales bacterium]|nr:hypothetical protein [Pirellulales bacterium]